MIKKLQERVKELESVVEGYKLLEEERERCDTRRLVKLMSDKDRGALEDLPF